jgi:hypothetical protein
MSIEDKLLNLKRKIEDAKNSKAKLEGRLLAEKDRLKDLGCKSVEEAEKVAKTKYVEANKLTKQVEEGVKKFEEQYGF